MRKLVFLLWILFLWPTLALAADTLDVSKDRSDNILIPNQGLVFNVPEGVTAELSGVISGQGPLIKQGPGTLVLSGENTHRGDTLVEAGLVRVTNANALNTKTGAIVVKGDGLEGSAAIESTVDLELGLTGELKLVVSDGGRFYTTDGKNMTIGMGADTQVRLSGAGSEIKSGAYMIIGQSGKVDFSVINGAKAVAAGDLVINRDNAAVTAYISGRGTRLVSSGDMYLGYSGHTEITLEMGALAQTQAAADKEPAIYLAYQPQSETKVFLKGERSKLISGGDLVVGYGGNANLDVRDKGQVKFQNTVFIGHTKTGRGVLRLTGYGCVLADYVQQYDINGHVTGLVKNPPVKFAEIYGDEDEEFYYEGYDYGNDYEDDEYVHNEASGDIAETEAGEAGEKSKHGQPDSLPGLSIIAGFEGYGELHVNRGARINVWNNIYAGYHKDAQGIIQASGNKAELKAGSNMYIGYYGRGELLFEDFASTWDYDEYHAANVYMAYEQGSAAKVDLDRSYFKIKTETFVGCCGQAVLNITNSGVLESEEGFIVAGVNEHGKAEINISGQSARLLSGSPYDEKKQGFLVVGSYGEAVVNVDNGGEIFGRGHIEIGTHNKGVVNLTGQHTSLRSYGEMTIGSQDGSHGELNVLDGAVLAFGPEPQGRVGHFYLGYSGGSTGVLNINNGALKISYHKMFYLGYYGKGVLNITNGGVFEGATSPHIAYHKDSEAVINVSGQGSRLALGGTFGHGGKAYAAISNGGLLAANSISLSYEDGSAEMLVDNARLDCRTMLVGNKRPALLNVVNGSVVNISEDFEIAQNSIAYASNVATVNVSNSKINVGNNLTMSLSGDGTLNISDGGEVTVGVNIKVTIFHGHGSITVDGPGSMLSGGKHFNIGIRGNVDMSILNGGAVKIARNVPIDSFGQLSIDGEGSALFAGVLVENEDKEAKKSEVKLTNGGKITIVERDHDADRQDDLREKAFFLFGQ